jgi:NitT/TauT family transport system substrate-binding protein
MKTRTLRLLIPLLAAVVLLAAAAYKLTSQPDSPLQTQPQSKEKRRPLRMGFSTWVGQYPLAIAMEKGIFSRQGVEVELLFKEDFNDLLADFAAGRLDGVDFAADGPLRLSKSSAVKVVLWSGDCLGCDSVVAQPRFQSVADLKGHKVGIRVGSFGEMLIDQMMKRNGLTIGDVQLVNADEKAVPGYLQNDTIQAGHTWEPYASQALKEGGKVVFSTKETPGLFSDSTMFHQAVLDERPDDVRAFIRGWFEAIEYWEANPKEGSEIVGKALKTPPADIMDARGAYEYFSPKEVARRLALGNDPTSLASIMQQHADFLIRTGALGRRPDIDKLITAEFLPTAAPSR